MKSRLLFLLILLFSVFVGAQEKLDYFLPGDIRYDKNIPTPEEFFNQQVGQWHLTHDQVLYYMKEIARVSGRAVLQEYARSYENRPLVHLIFTSEENQKRLGELKEFHQKFSEPEQNIPAERVPLVVNLGYGVHGNESSATNASVLTAYFLAAAQGEKIERLLSQTIILVDPCLNPDGFTRHSTWANMHQSITDMTKTESRQFSEVWPGGRTNHYWFDLNRDYLLLVHPESRGRVEKFHEWKPNIVTDHHEMEANSTFFFQPGVPSRNNPLTPEKNYTLTSEIAKYHSRFLDRIGAAYFSEENFDDYYFGKGSSYPDINGSVGILFEQAGFRGRIRETANGVRKLAYGIRNQFTVTLSTLEAAVALKDELLQFQKEFYRDAFRLAEKDAVKAYVFGSENDQVKTQQLIETLNRHQIDVFVNDREITKNSIVFKPGSSYVVPAAQKQYRLIKSVFGFDNSFADSTFYDVSTWTFPSALDIPFAEINSLKEVQISKEKATTRVISGKVVGGKSELAYLFRWNEYLAPSALFDIQNAGLMAKVATEKFSFMVNGIVEDFSSGTILVPVSEQRLNREQIFELVKKTAEKTGVDFYGLSTGLSSQGIDWGSNSFVLLQKPEVLMLAGNGSGSRDAGEIWHLFDQRYQIPVCLAESSALAAINLAKYNVLILPGGSFSEINAEVAAKIKKWVQEGGTLIATTGATSWTTRNELSKIKFKKGIEPDSTRFLSYAERTKENTLNTISGAIFNTVMDLSHPLCYGYTRSELPVFKTGNQVAEKTGMKYAEPVCFSSQPFISGFVSDKNTDRIKNAPVVTVESAGRGKVISYHESMTFRGFWMGTNKLLMNGVFFGNVIR